MISPLMQRRLNDGARALALEEPNGLPELRDYVDQLGAAIAAMQSLDDLGSPEANHEAMITHDALMTRWQNARKKLSTLQTTPDV